MRYLLAVLFPFFLIADKSILSRTQVHMGTFVTVTLPEKYQAKFQDVFSLIADVEDSLSSFKSSALLYKLNKYKTISNAPVLKDAIQKSIAYHDATDGYFDITIGAITKKLYKFGETARSPSREALQKAVLDIDKIAIFDSKISLEQNITLDLGGMGKGYAVDRVADYFYESNITQGTIALSGDIRCLDKCEILIQSPFSEQHFSKVMTTYPNTAISTSGTYRRYAATKTEHHLIDPKQKAPQQNFVSLSLFSIGDNTKLDAYATAVSVMPPKKALTFLKKHKDISFILVNNEGNILFSDSAGLLSIYWIPFSVRATITPSSENNTTSKSTKESLIHPKISHPIEMSR